MRVYFFCTDEPRTRNHTSASRRPDTSGSAKKYRQRSVVQGIHFALSARSIRSDCSVFSWFIVHLFLIWQSVFCFSHFICGFFFFTNICGFCHPRIIANGARPRCHGRGRRGVSFCLLLMCVPGAWAHQFHARQLRDIFAANGHLKTITHSQFGVTVSPKGILMTAKRMEYVPLVITLVSPDWVQAEHSKFGPTIEVANCSGAGLGLPGFIREIKAKFRYNYHGIIDSDFYMNLLSNFCRNDNMFCGQSNSTARRAHGGHSSTAREFEEPLRSKRFLGVLLSSIFGVSGLANSVINTLHVQQLQGKISAITSAVSKVIDRVDSQDEQIRRITVANEHVYGFMHDSIQSLHDTISRVQCQDLQYASKIYTSLLEHTFKANLVAAVQAMNKAILEGHVTPELISIPKLTSLLSKIPGFNQTLLSKQVSLVYRYGVVFPVSIDFESLKFGVLLQVPWIHPEEVWPYFSVGNVGWLHQGHVYKLNLPNSVTRPLGKGVFWGVDETQCKLGPGMIFCQNQVFAAAKPYAPCLAILESQNTNYEICGDCLQGMLPVEAAQDEICTLLAGILIRTKQTHYYWSNVNSHEHHVKGVRKVTPLNGVIWYPHNMYSHLQVGGAIFSSFMEQQASQFEIPYSERHNVSLPQIELPPLNFTLLDMAIHENRRIQLSEKYPKLSALIHLSNSPLSPLLLWFVLIILLIVMVLADLRYWQRMGRFPCSGCCNRVSAALRSARRPYQAVQAMNPDEDCIQMQELTTPLEAQPALGPSNPRLSPSTSIGGRLRTHNTRNRNAVQRLMYPLKSNRPAGGAVLGSGRIKEGSMEMLIDSGADSSAIDSDFRIANPAHPT